MSHEDLAAMREPFYIPFAPKGGSNILEMLIVQSQAIEALIAYRLAIDSHPSCNSAQATMTLMGAYEHLRDIRVQAERFRHG